MAKIPALEQFTGFWVLSRRIEDMRGGLDGQLEGRTVFTRDEGGGLIYEEQGELRYGEMDGIEATRRYLWRQSNGGIGVFFADGSEFHTILGDRLMPDATHHCPPDLYHVSYDFTRWPDWSSVWKVVGPRKNYRMVSVYRRE